MTDYVKTFKKKPEGVFVFIDDDPHELNLLKHAMKELQLDNQVVCCENGEEAFSYLKNTKDSIFIILSDMNMPRMDGLQLKRLIDITPELILKAIPFIFHSNTSSVAEIKAAYATGIQAFMRKANSLDETIDTLRRIIAVWTDVVHPKDL
jgi:CheY-like chemotaxis protein